MHQNSNNDIIKIHKFAGLAFLIFFISLGIDIVPVVLAIAVPSFDIVTWIRIIVYIGITLHTLIAGWLITIGNKMMSPELARKYHLVLWGCLSFFLPWVFIWCFRYNLSRAYFEAQSNPEYLANIKWWTSRRNLEDTETNTTIVLQFNSVDDKLALLEKLYHDKQMDETQYEALKTIILNDDYPHA